MHPEAKASTLRYLPTDSQPLCLHPISPIPCATTSPLAEPPPFFNLKYAPAPKTPAVHPHSRALRDSLYAGPPRVGRHQSNPQPYQSTQRQPQPCRCLTPSSLAAPASTASLTQGQPPPACYLTANSEPAACFSRADSASPSHGVAVPPLLPSFLTAACPPTHLPPIPSTTQKPVHTTNSCIRPLPFGDRSQLSALIFGVRTILELVRFDLRIF